MPVSSSAKISAKGFPVDNAMTKPRKGKTFNTSRDRFSPIARGSSPAIRPVAMVPME